MRRTSRPSSRHLPMPAWPARIAKMIDGDLDGEGRARCHRAHTGRAAAWQSTRAAPTCCRRSCSAIPPEHPLANREFLFPYASVVPVRQEDIPRALGPSLVVTAITHDRGLIGRLLASPNVGRLNLGGIPTCKISWDQPHEGNLFDHLYARRAFQLAV